jgi:predicted dehydrogenase
MDTTAELVPLRVGIIGLGAWGSRAHLPAFQSLPGVTVTALADLDEGTVRRVAEQSGVTRAESDPLRLLRDPDGIDAVVIATPDDTHHDLAMAAFASGLHVLCEKPLAYSLEQAVELVAAAAQARRVAKMGFLFRHSPVVTRMRQLVAEGAIGTVQLFEHVNVNAQFFDPERPMHWKMQSRHAPGGVYVEYGAHTIDLALWFGGPLTRVVANAVTLIPQRPMPDGGSAPVDLDDAASWIGSYASGGEALFRSGWASLPVGTGGMRVYGSEGTLLWAQTGRRSEALLLATRDDPTERTVLTFEPPYDAAIDAGPFPLGIYAHYNRRLAASFVDDVRNGIVTWPSFLDGLATQRVLAAMQTSLREQRWAEVPDWQEE